MCWWCFHTDKSRLPSAHPTLSQNNVPALSVRERYCRIVKVMPRHYQIRTRMSRIDRGQTPTLRLLDRNGRASVWPGVGEVVVRGGFALVDEQVQAMERKGLITAYARRFLGRRKVVLGNDVALRYQPCEPRGVGPSTTVTFFARPRVDAGRAVAEGNKLTAKLQRRVDRQLSEGASVSRR
jgi:hypothetical protein